MPVVVFLFLTIIGFFIIFEMLALDNLWLIAVKDFGPKFHLVKSEIWNRGKTIMPAL